MVATTVIQPIDMIKVRIQLLGEGGAAVGSSNPILLAGKVIRDDGFLSLYRGLSAALLRQATYTTARMGIFKTVSDAVTPSDGSATPFYLKTFAGLAAGGLGSVFGTPADVALIRMQADSTLPLDKRRNYRNVGDALARITREEGLSGLFKGNGPVVLRAMALNVGMLSSYDQTRDLLTPHIESAEVVNLAAKFVAGFLASAFSLPFDFIKTRLQKMQPNAEGKLPYNGFIDCAGKVATQEGVFAFYRGFMTYVSVSICNLTL